jgi:uncharacterized low-complexity protein
LQTGTRRGYLAPQHPPDALRAGIARREPIMQTNQKGNSMRLSTSKLTLAAATAAFLIGVAAPAFAQDASAPAAPQTAPQAASAAQSTKAEQKKQAKAQRKAQRKAARDKKNAELKTLEQNGYNPAVNDPNYPQNLQNAEKKANAAPAGASQ